MKRMQDGQSCEAAVGPTLQEGFATSSRVVHEVGEMLTERQYSQASIRSEYDATLQLE